MSVDTPPWVRHAVFYHVFPDRLASSPRVPKPGPLEAWDALPTISGFKGGDLLGVVDHLDRLAGLGITALYLSPVFASAANHRYHPDDYLAVDPLLGGDDALRELLEAAHARGMRVVLDGVFNHVGRGFWPFHHVVENGAASPYRGWFHLDDAVVRGDRGLQAYPGPGQLAEMAAIAAAGAPDGEASRRVLGYEAWWDLPALPKLNLQAPAPRAHVLEVAEHWLRFGIDGWRLDVPEEVGEDFWREFRARVRSVSPEAYLVGEVWHPKPEWLRGEHFDAFMNYPLMRAILGYVGGRHLDMEAVRSQRTLAEGLLPLDAASFMARVLELHELHDPAVTAVQLNLLGSHDTPRLRTLLGGDLDAVRLACLAQLTLPGAPCIYYGDEIGMLGGADPGCRAGFPRDPAAWTAEPHDWVADLIALRHSSAALRDGELASLGARGTASAWWRRHGEEAFVVVLNAGEGPLDWELTLPVEARQAEVVHLRGNRDPAPGAVLRDAEADAPSTLAVRVAPRDGTVVRLAAVGRP
jgi:cyclomaltodextrinase / maltogenic alpha-amylase / neopullulanase